MSLELVAPTLSSTKGGPVPGRVRCPQCGEIWPGMARFCGRCGQLLQVIEEFSALDPIAEDRNRSRRRLMRALVLVITMLVIVAAIATLRGPEEPPEDPLLEPQLQAELPLFEA